MPNDPSETRPKNPKPATPSDGGTFVGPVGPFGPAGPVIPEDWPKGANSELTGHSQYFPTGDCKSWFERRRLRGPIQYGPNKFIGTPLLMAVYQGNCTWQINKVQTAVRSRFQLQQTIGVKMTNCAGVLTESRVYTGPLIWANLGAETIVVETPVGVPFKADPPQDGICPDKYWPWTQSLPSQAKEELGLATPGEKAKDPTIKPVEAPWPPEIPPSGQTLAPTPTPPSWFVPPHSHGEHQPHAPGDHLDPPESPQEEAWKEWCKKMEEEAEQMRRMFEEIEREREEAESEAP